ncbi:MAG: hypothetical protein AMXMBFR84_13660 [Candidatus Hydrogenedentota bacterium]
MLDRRGHVRVVIVGDSKSVFIPDLSAFRLGRDRLCGLRLIHTHLKSEPLTDDDLTDLALLRLDLIGAIETTPDGTPGHVHIAHLLPENQEGQPWLINPPTRVHDLEDSFTSMIDALEEEFYRTRRPRSANDPRDRAILIHVSSNPTAAAEESLQELQELVTSAGLVGLDSVVQRRAVDPKFVLGRGRLQSTVIRAMQLGAEVLVFDLNLTPAQVNALSEFTDLKILDRTQVILDIFAQRAQTREGKIQVELAQLRYMLPRLGAKQAALAYSRLTGGIGGRGPGETKLEIDRRRAQDRIAHLEREVNKLGERRRLRRSERTRRAVPIVSIVGYTNAGKSTLLNRLTRSDVLAQDALFATLNPVSRRLRFPKEREIVITDTVGFIRNLPADLMAAFRTTLEELDDADLLLHVIDASREDCDDLKRTVDNILRELGLDGKPTLLVLNKTDRCRPSDLEGLLHRFDAVPVCALDEQTFGPLMDSIEGALWTNERLEVET